MGFAPIGKRRLFTAHTRCGPLFVQEAVIRQDICSRVAIRPVGEVTGSDSPKAASDASLSALTNATFQGNGD